RATHDQGASVAPVLPREGRMAARAEKVFLTDRTLESLKPAKPGQRYIVYDSNTPKLGVRVGDKGEKRGKQTYATQRTFVLVARVPGSPHPVRRELGKVGELGLAAARKKAQAWLELIDAGKDPADIEKQQAAAEVKRRKNTFAAVAEDFIAGKLPK